MVEVKCISKKHWTAYVVPVAILCIGLFLITMGSYMLYIGLALIFIALRKVVILSRVRWVLSDNDLLICRGILPWQRTQMQIPIFNIYESYVSFGMFGHFLDYGSISIRRTEGVTSQISETSLAGAKRLSGRINSLVQEYVQQKSGGNHQLNKGSFARELQHLVELRDNGELTAAEYERLKQKLINSD
jgi:hypothetical protein